MTASELIQILNTYDGNMKVVTPDYGAGYSVPTISILSKDSQDNNHWFAGPLKARNEVEDMIIIAPVGRRE